MRKSMVFSGDEKRRTEAIFRATNPHTVKCYSLALSLDCRVFIAAIAIHQPRQGVQREIRRDGVHHQANPECAESGLEGVFQDDDVSFAAQS